MVKLTQQPTNCLSVFNHFVGLALKGLIHERPMFPSVETSKWIYTANQSPDFDFFVSSQVQPMVIVEESALQRNLLFS